MTRDLLRVLRNDLPMDFTIQQLGNKGPCSKMAEGRLRFICPNCGEFRAAINPRNNLAHCFGCGKNINNIDLLLSGGHEFKAAVALLENWLQLYKLKKSVPQQTPRSTETVEKCAVPIGTILALEPVARHSGL
jgi:hypothetical protein